MPKLLLRKTLRGCASQLWPACLTGPLAGPDRDISGKVREGTRRLAESDGKLLIFRKNKSATKGCMALAILFP
jgi:hypothetical protein